MKPIRSLERILILGENHFVGKALVIELLESNPDIECWVSELNAFNDISTDLHTRLHLFEAMNSDMLLKAWKTNRWDAVLHIVSDYSENAPSYKSQLRNQKSLIGGALRELAQTIDLKPLYVEVETDWVFSMSLDVEIREQAQENNLLYLEGYADRISIETTNVLADNMQPNHWIFNFIKALETKTAFGVPCEGVVLRDWIALEDYIEAICTILTSGKIGEQYTVVGFNEWTNYDLLLLIGATYDRIEARENGAFKSQLCNDKISCRNSYKETKIGVSYLRLNEIFKPKAMYDIVEQLVCIVAFSNKNII